MGNICGSAKTHSDSPTHHRLGSVSEPTPSNAAAVRTQSKPPVQASSGDDTEDRERRARAAEERAKAAAARGTNTSNPKQGQLAAKLNKPVNNQPYQREEEPLRWD